MKQGNEVVFNENRKWRDEYLLYLSSFEDLGWVLCFETKNQFLFSDNCEKLQLFIKVGDSDIYLHNIGFFDTEDDIKDYLIKNENTFKIDQQTRNELLLARYADKVLDYKIELNPAGEVSLIAEFGKEKDLSMFFELWENVISTTGYLNLDEFHGKTVKEVYDILTDANEESYLGYMEGVYNFAHGIEDSYCSYCRGGGCPHCEPKRFI